jgi:hypothetical protein
MLPTDSRRRKKHPGYSCTFPTLLPRCKNGLQGAISDEEYRCFPVSKSCKTSPLMNSIRYAEQARDPNDTPSNKILLVLERGTRLSKAMSPSPALQLLLPATPRWGILETDMDPKAQQIHQTTAVSQDSALGLASFGIVKGVLLPPSNPTLVRHEHVGRSKRNSRHLV